jgi:hypothetical protein
LAYNYLKGNYKEPLVYGNNMSNAYSNANATKRMLVASSPSDV